MNNEKLNLITPWDINAKYRHDQILSGKDISFTKILAPTIINLIRDIPDFNNFVALDVGCGSGIFTNILAKNMKFVKGIDPSKKSIELALDYSKGVKNVDFECTRIENLKVEPQNLFDIVVAHMTLHTVEDLELVCNKIKLVLKENGVFLFSIPHPCFYLEQREGIDQNKFRYNVETYLEIPFRISLDSKELPAKTPFFHRGLQLYSEALYKAGFLTLRILEPFPEESVMELYPHNKRWKYPHFMIFICHC